MQEPGGINVVVGLGGTSDPFASVNSKATNSMGWRRLRAIGGADKEGGKESRRT